MSRIEQLIDEIEEYVEGCKPAPFSQSKLATFCSKLSII